MNDCFMASDYYKNSHEKIIEIAYFIFLAIFIIEMILRIIADPSIIYKSKLDIIDFIIIFSSFLECIIPLKRGCLLALRSYRIFINIGSITKDYTRIISIIGKASQALLLQFVIAFIFIYIYAIFGMQLFAGKLKFNSNFDVDLINGYFFNIWYIK